ncbi:hypothetical protein DS745_03915 [Anaerobacillus alkaliphilus]|uniref:Uncharacterized protein n=1 Tax=Anaerobacillus alkaliphilus TaxID=1548597 RepID=A0A4Q0VYA7_9BACI|nr:hypothetical protein [Anaerobacillus alkaliphilus]RXJ04539.1 hypothetical protein DS745_03915 [Anaerobacillus alkaliphilus]
MKKYIYSILIMLLLTQPMAVTLANSGPAYWEGHPSTEMMTIASDTPIIVENEELVFDFTNSDPYHSVHGKVTATYQMFNPTDESQVVEMVFPFVGTVIGFSDDEVVITSDHQILTYDLYVGDLISERFENKKRDFEFSKILSTISKEPYSARNLTEEEQGKLYIIEVTPKNEERIHLGMSFYYNGKNTKLITKGFNGYRYDNGQTQLSAWCYQPERLEIFVLGDDIDFDIQAFTDGEMEEKTDLYSVETSVVEVSVKDYLFELLKEADYSEQLTDTQLYNVFAEVLDQYFSRDIGYTTKYDLLEHGYHERILSLVYQVEFPPKTTKTVAVSYIARGTMDKTKTAKPLHTFDYILNPAKNWSDFGSLAIRILTPEQAPFIVDSTIDFGKVEKNVYEANLFALPEEDLSFTLYEHEEIGFGDRIGAKIGLILLVLLIVTIVVVIRVRKR